MWVGASACVLAVECVRAYMGMGMGMGMVIVELVSPYEHVDGGTEREWDGEWL